MNTRVKSGSTTILPPKGGETSYLVEESFAMEMQRREMEQQGQRKLAKVQVVEHSEPVVSAGLDADIQNHLRQHPRHAQSQRFSGVADTVTPEPPANTAARREFDNNKREQDKEKQHRLGNIPQYGNTIKPKPP